MWLIFSIVIAVILGLSVLITYYMYCEESDKVVSEVSTLDKKLSNLRGMKMIIITDTLGCALMVLSNYDKNFNLFDKFIVSLCVITAIISVLYFITYLIIKYEK
jgi:hypothetical protein